jgi:SAM-dependent methyltransferase
MQVIQVSAGNGPALRASTMDVTSDLPLTVPPWSEGYIALQRTQYQHPIGRVIRKFFPWLGYDRRVLGYVERLRNREIATLYSEDIRREYELIKSSLPERAERILDIGCGIAGIDVYLFRHYGGMPRLYLMDQARLDQIYYGYENRAAFYNDIGLARLFLNQNGVPNSNIHFVEAEVGNIDRMGTDFDLVVSLIAWGFHFPLSTYLEEVLRSLRANARIVVDLRRGSEGVDLLAKRKLRYTVIYEHPKYQRICIVP